MKVISDTKYTLFKDLRKGDTFMFAFYEEDDEVYMKIDTIDTLSGSTYNAIHLNNSNLHHISDDVAVFKVEAELHIS